MIKISGKTGFSTNELLFNGVGIGIAAICVVYVARSYLFTSYAEPCSQRYLHAVAMPMERDGKAISVADLQARVAGTDWNLDERAKIVRLKEGPATTALLLDLSTKKVVARATSSDETKPKDGVGFVWSPRQLKTAASACLAYSVFLPPDFEFGEGGKLPGFTGLAPAREKDDESKAEAAAAAFSLQSVWTEKGTTDVHAVVPAYPAGILLGASRQGYALERGLWSRIEQEIVLNAPGKSDGLYRLWLNGELIVERNNVSFYAGTAGGKSAVIGGMTAEVSQKAREAKASQKVWLSKFEMHWK